MARNSYLADLKYHADHDWARIDGDEATFGITWYAQELLGEIVFFNAPVLGTVVTKDEQYTEVESVKAASEPLSGEIIGTNDALSSSPESINEDPYGAGWLVKIKLWDASEAESLMDASTYAASLSRTATTK